MTEVAQCWVLRQVDADFTVQRARKKKIGEDKERDGKVERISTREPKRRKMCSAEAVGRL